MQNRIAVEPSGPSVSARPSERWRPSSMPEAVVVSLARRACRDTSTARAVAEWRRTAQETTPLLAPEVALLARRLMPPAVEPCLVAVRQRDRITAALPLARRGRAIAALRTDHTPRVDFVGDAASVPALWRALVEMDGWDVFELRGVPSDSPMAQRFPDLARGCGFQAYAREVGRAPFFDVRGIEERVHRRFRGDMRRLERQLGGVELERITTYDAAAMGELLRLEASGWKGQAGSAIACDAPLEHYYRALARVFAHRGQLTLAFLRARGQRIAGCFALEDRTTFHLLKIGYDEAFAHFGPGQLLVRETAADAARRGLTTYDLLGKEAPYKMKWTESAKPHVEIVIYAPTLRGRALHFTRERARPIASGALRRIRERSSAIVGGRARAAHDRVGATPGHSAG